MTRDRRPATAVIGAGRLARSLAPALAAAGYPVVAVAAPRLAAARRLCRLVPRASATTRPEAAADKARLVLLAVPDREIGNVARGLAEGLERGWSHRTVLHHAGALGLEPLAPLARAGASTGVLHPLQCLGRTPPSRPVLPGSRARIEGDRGGRAMARRVAADLGLVPLPLRRGLRPSGRAAYHAAASLAANDLVALLDLASQLLQSIGLTRRRALEALLPLVRGTLAHAEAGGLESALSGPAARGDLATTESQLRSIARLSRDGARAHRLLSLRLLELAARTGGLSESESRRLRRALARESSRTRGSGV